MSFGEIIEIVETIAGYLTEKGISENMFNEILRIKMIDLRKSSANKDSSNSSIEHQAYTVVGWDTEKPSENLNK